MHAVVLLIKTEPNSKLNTIAEPIKQAEIKVLKPAVQSELKALKSVVQSDKPVAKPSQSPLPEFSYLYGKPKSTGLLRRHRSDFKVFEKIPFEPCGQGEHLFIHIRKTGANTAFVAKQLAQYFSVKESLVSYAGLKDRFAVTEQWFGVHVPGKQSYDLSDVNIEGVEVLSYKRHNKKLRIGGLDGNRFEITLRDVTEIDELIRRWQVVTNFGVPNYFGEQRFGINGGNIEKALGLFSGKKVQDKKKRGMYLSAARSLIFNQMVGQRIEQQTFDSLINGDVLMLAGTQSVFLADVIDESLQTRLVEHDLDITASMWGAGELMTTGDARAFEQSIADGQLAFCEGLPRFGLKQERRRIRLTIKDTNISVENDVVTLSFFLPSGAYATTIMRELIDYKDMTERVDVSAARHTATATNTQTSAVDNNKELKS
nr:tRNA pseudouridine(13) synthase TruD [Colwellia sp. MB02u-6]